MKKILLSSVLLLAMALALPVSAAPKAKFNLPAKAVEVAPGLYRLGTAYDVASDNFAEGYAIIHKKGNDAKGGNATKRPGDGSTTCYGFMASGAKWKNVEPWEVYTGAGLDGVFLLNNLSTNISKWEVAAGTNILGLGSLDSGTVTDPYVLDNLNQVSFGNLDSGTIAVTVVWGIFSGPKFNRRLVAWDQIYNSDYQWSSSGEAGKMDFENIATHELGHSVGMADIYDSSCSEVTMYGYGNYGETKKSSLESADIAGIRALY